MTKKGMRLAYEHRPEADPTDRLLAIYRHLLQRKKNSNDKGSVSALCRREGGQYEAE